MVRKRLNEESVDAKAGGGNYFAAPSAVECFTSGCVLLDCVLGGRGWAKHRVANVIGDKSTGKTLLMIEACANYARKFKKDKIKYREIESAFDQPYAGALGMPLDRVDFGENRMVATVEDLFDDIDEFCDSCKKAKVGGLYITDSLDPLSDAAEMDADFGAASFGAQKAKDMSKLFRKLVNKMPACGVTLIIVSQIRDKIGVTFGKKYSRSGGKALDFYGSQVIYLAHLSRLKATRKGIERAVGIQVKAMCEKNKVGLPFRDCEFPIKFGFGIDDIESSIAWLEETKQKDLFIEGYGKMTPEALRKELGTLEDPEKYRVFRKELNRAIKSRWFEIEKEFIPERKKY